MVYANPGYQGIAKRPEMAGKAAGFGIAMRPGRRRALPDTPYGRLQDLVQTVLANLFLEQRQLLAGPLSGEWRVSADRFMHS